MEFGETAGGAEALRAMYGAIAHRYDLLNNVLSFNQANSWRRFAADRSGLGPGGCGLDVACGTGLLTLELARRVGRSGRVVGVDFCDAMLARARANAARTPFWDTVRFSSGEAGTLSFADRTFDCAAIGFALRVVPDVARVLGEMIRVVKPGGRVVSLELARPVVPGFKQVYWVYMQRMVPLMGRLGLGFEGPYDFLAGSAAGFLHQAEVRDLFLGFGLADVRYYELTGGVAAVHVGTRPRPV